MHFNVKNVNLVIAKIPSIVMAVLMISAIIFITQSQISETELIFQNQCRQYDASVNLFLSGIKNKANSLTTNAVFHNYKHSQYSQVKKEIYNFSFSRNASSSSTTFSNAYVVFKNEQVVSNIWPTEFRIYSFQELSQLEPNTVLFEQNNQNSDYDVMVLSYPILNKSGEVDGYLVNYISTDHISDKIIYDAKKPIALYINSKPANEVANKSKFGFLYSLTNDISLCNGTLNITFKMSILPILITVLILSLIFFCIFAVFNLCLKFILKCIYSSIYDPVDQIKKTISKYTDKISDGGASNE